jgi:hypothetical protein
LIPTDRTPEPQASKTETPPPAKRFRLERLEERIAPKKKKPGGSGSSASGSSNTLSFSTIF